MCVHATHRSACDENWTAFALLRDLLRRSVTSVQFKQYDDSGTVRAGKKTVEKARLPSRTS